MRWRECYPIMILTDYTQFDKLQLTSCLVNDIEYRVGSVDDEDRRLRS